jgi:2-polyprenyl-3-methyl-5-hydroxy-6-metoxy-1,4-benzoquinol methylase
MTIMALVITSPGATKRRDALVERLFESAIGMLDVMSVYVGDRLGLYQVLAERSSLTARQLAAATGTNERYIREWLEQQASTGILEVEEDAVARGNAERRRFRLPTGHAEVLIDRDSLNCLAGLLRLTVGVSKPLPALLEAYKTGAGVPYPDFGVDTREGIAEMNRPMFLNLLGQEWLPAIPELHARLQADPPARVLDAGCGLGWSTIAIARAYPNATVHGFDADEASIAAARSNAAAAGLSDRVTFAIRDASRPGIAGRFDLVTAFETVHDMGRPVAALSWMRDLLVEGGMVLVADERVGETFSAPGDAIERLNYGFSALHCLAATIAESDEAATGTVMRPPTLRRYAQEAGFSAVEIAPVEHDFWRFYLLRP